MECIVSRLPSPLSFADSSEMLKAEPSQTGLIRKRSKGGSSTAGSKLLRQQSGSGSGCGVLAETSGIGGRDSSLFLFRALGKILYFKRK